MEDGVSVLTQQMLNVTSPKLSEKVQKIIEKESNAVALLVYFLTFLNEPESLVADCVSLSKLDAVVADDGIPYMIQVFYMIYFIIITLFYIFFSTLRSSCAIVIINT